MLLTECNETETMEMLKEEGREESENKFASLISKLASAGKNNDIAKVAENKAYRDKLYLDFGII